jgi:hypothetical protein
VLGCPSPPRFFASAGESFGPDAGVHELRPMQTTACAVRTTATTTADVDVPMISTGASTPYQGPGEWGAPRRVSREVEVLS